MKYQRKEDWPIRLADYIASRRGMPFAWGVNDCVMNAAGAIKAMTEVDPLEGLTRWKSEKGAARVLKRMGGLEKAAEAILVERIPPLFAQRGDIVLVRAEIPGISGEDHLAVCGGALCWAPGKEGLITIPLDEGALVAWRV